ncbi:DUF2304 domain-containing protein [Candidatus Omnitrophota bacterium]
MSFWTRFVALLVSFLVIVYILKTIRSKRIREEYVILWIVTAVGAALLVIFENISVRLARLIGAENDIVMMTFFVFAYVLALLVHYSLRISELMHSIKELNQEIALLKNKLEKKDD